MTAQLFYTEQIHNLNIQRQQTKRRDAWFSVARLINGSAVLIMLYFALLGQSTLLFSFTAICLFVFVVLVILHHRLRKQIAFLDALIKINQDEIAYLKGDLSPFPMGINFMEATHPFVKDLDIFGSGSLFQRINRSTHPTVQSLLAERLKSNDLREMRTRQQIVQELAPLVSWRQEFMAKAARLNYAPEQINVLINSYEKDQIHPKWTKPFVMWLFSAWFPVLSFFLLFQFEWAALEWLVYPFMLNLVIFSSTLKVLRDEHQAADQLSKVFELYSELIAHIDNLPSKHGALEKILLPLHNPKSDAGKALKALSNLLSRMDSIYNVVGSVLLNGSIFYHWHIYKRLLNWKHRHGKELRSWVIAINELESYLSLANYAYNHPNFTYPRKAEKGFIFKAHGIAHPFIPESRSVANNIDFEQMKAVILTGSNMAGKSTFLRAVGLSMVMASSGLPVCAEALELSNFKLLSSMKPEDDVNANTSYFQAEVERLRRLMDIVEEGGASFLLLDEILRGTNSEDKRQGTRAFLIKLFQHDMKCIAATHDIDIADLTAKDSGFKAMYFESGYNGESLTFDYKLRNGVCTSPNATQLLKLKKLID